MCSRPVRDRMHFRQWKRRAFITLLGGAAVAWPLAARAQQPGLPVIGLLSSRSAATDTQSIAVFRQALNEGGFVEGQNVVIDYRWADGQYDRLPALATSLVRRQVAVIVTIGGEVSGLAAKAATATIPIVFVSGTDPVAIGLVTNLNRPAGNITGASGLLSEQMAKRLGLLQELVPKAPLIGVLANPSYSGFDLQFQQLKEAAGTLQQELHVDDPHAILSTSVRRSRRAHELRNGHSRAIPRAWGVRRADTQRRKAGRSAGSTADEI